MFSFRGWREMTWFLIYFWYRDVVNPFLRLKIWNNFLPRLNCGLRYMRNLDWRFWPLFQIRFRYFNRTVILDDWFITVSIQKRNLSLLALFLRRKFMLPWLILRLLCWKKFLWMTLFYFLSILIPILLSSIRRSLHLI